MAFKTKVKKRNLDAKNEIQNSDLAIWQKGTNINALDAYGPDRFFGNSASGNFSQILATDTASYPYLASTGFEYAVSAEQQAGGGSITQRIEARDMKKYSVGDMVTFSVYASGVSAFVAGVSLGIATPTLGDNDWSGSIDYLTLSSGNDDLTSIFLGDPQDRLNGMDRFSYTFSITQNMLKGIQFSIGGDKRVNGTKGWLAHTLALTGFMFHEGEEVIPFKLSGILPDVELQLCKRYFEKSYDIDVPVGTIGSYAGAIPAIAHDSELLTGTKFNEPKRVIPSVIVFSPSSSIGNRVRRYTGGSNKVASAVAISKEGFREIVADTSFVDGAGYDYHYTADANL